MKIDWVWVGIGLYLLAQVLVILFLRGASHE
jgi:hypothetical protein